jgi:general secretion pathway protein K
MRAVRNQKGVALILAIFTVVMISYLVVEISYETSVEYVVNSNAIYRLKAYYAAKSGLELSLLRIKLYTKVQRQFGKQLGSQSKMLDMIWNFPFAWPLAVPAEASSVDKDMINEAMKQSQMEGSYFTQILDEGSKFDLNDLASDSKKIVEATKRNLTNIFTAKLEDEAFMKTHPSFRPEELVEAITDFVDLDTTSTLHGSENTGYPTLPNNSGMDFQMPPNRGFRSVEELRLVPGVDDQIFNLLKDQVTVFGMKAINPNYASKDVIMSLDKSITKEVAQEILNRRENEKMGGPFKDGSDNCKGDFWGFVNSKGGRIDEETMAQIPLKCDRVTNFRIKSVGEYNGVTREITAIVYDLKMSAQVVAEAVLKEKQAHPEEGAQPGATPKPTPTPAPPEPLPKGAPRIVYYNER